MKRQTALITGASSGIGLDLSRLFARDGCDVVLVARSREALQALADELATRHGIEAHVFAADLARPESPRELAAAVAARGLEIDFLVNNAGFGLAGRFADLDLETELRMIQVNVAALTALTGLFLPPMLARRRGRILNVASTAAFQPGPLMAVYYATKAYVLSLSEAIAEEVRGTGVTVTALCPGPTATGFADTAAMSRSRLFRLAQPAKSMDVARAGYRAMLRGKPIRVTGAANLLLAQSVRIAPRALVRKIARALQENA